jgi:hypothetical protein
LPPGEAASLMKKTRFIRLISAFSPQEFRQFGRFLRSPFFNSNKALVRLYVYLKKYHPAFPSLALTEKKVFKHLFPGKNFSEHRMYDISHEMLKLCEKFLSYTGFDKDTFNVNLFLLREINHRNLPDIYQHYYSLTNDYLNAMSAGYDTFYNRNVLDKELLRFYNTFDIEKARDKLQPVMENTVKTSIFELLRCFVGVQNASVVFNMNYELRLREEIMGFLEQNKFLNDPLLELYYHLFNISLRENWQSYRKVMKLKEKYNLLYNDDIKREILILLHNYLNLHKHVFNENGNDEMEQLINNIINDPVFEDSGHFVLPNLYYNYIYLLISSKQYERAERFLHDNKQKLICLNSEDYVNFFFGEIYEAQCKFKEALAYFSKLSNKDKNLFLVSRIYSLICYYELGYRRNLEVSAIGVIQFVKRHANSMRWDEIELYEPFLKYFQRLMLLKQSIKPVRNNRRKRYSRAVNSNLIGLKNDITNEKRFFNKKWLLSKIDSLEK